jgi:hypothetical protein
LTDEADEIFSKQISELNLVNGDNKVEYGYGKNLCCFNEMVVLTDGRVYCRQNKNKMGTYLPYRLMKNMQL